MIIDNLRFATAGKLEFLEFKERCVDIVAGESCKIVSGRAVQAGNLSVGKNVAHHLWCTHTNAHVNSALVKVKMERRFLLEETTL
ncbi:hypothetical protein SLA2020_050200 [Shorea laevis]